MNRLPIAALLLGVASLAAARERPAAPAPIPPIPEAFRTAGAVVLEDVTVWDMRDHPRMHRSVRVLVLDRRGFDLADQSVYYDTEDEELLELRARTISPGGQVREVPPDLVQDVLAWRHDEAEVRARHFTFPAVEPGAVLEWSVSIRHDDLFPFFTWEVQREVPVLRAVLETRSGSELWVRARSRGPLAKHCSMAAFTASAKMSHRIDCASVPAFVEEDDAPPEGDLILHALISWEQYRGLLDHAVKQVVRDHVAERIEGCLTDGDATEALGRSLAGGEPSDEAKIARISRYVDEELRLRVEAGEDCRSPDQVVASKGGAPEEVALTMLVLLRGAGVETTPVLVADRSEGRFDATMPDLGQYDHLLLEVGGREHPRYLDPGCRDCQPGVPHWRFCGTGGGGLRISQDGLVQVSIPPAPPKDNAERVVERIRLAADGTAQVDGTVSWHVQADAAMRGWLRDEPPERRDEVFLTRFRGRLRDTSVDGLDPDRRRDATEASYRLARDGAAIPAGLDLLLPAPDERVLRYLEIPEPGRVQPLWLRYGRALHVSATFELPDGYRAGALPAPAERSAAGFEWQAAWTAGERPRELQWTARVTTPEGRIEPQDFPALRAFVSEVLGDLGRGVVLSREVQP